MFQHFLFTYFKHEQPCLCTLLLLILLLEITSGKQKLNSCIVPDQTISLLRLIFEEASEDDQQR